MDCLISLISDSLRNVMCLNVIDYKNIIYLIFLVIIFSLMIIYRSNKTELLIIFIEKIYVKRGINC